MIKKRKSRLYVWAAIFCLPVLAPSWADGVASPDCLTQGNCASVATNTTGRISPAAFAASPTCSAVTSTCPGTVMIPFLSQTEWARFNNDSTYRPSCLTVSSCSENGVCGTAAPYSCTVGSAFSNAVSGLNDYWYCSGTNGGASSGQCSYGTSQNGQCGGGGANVCAYGAAFNESSDGVNNYWYCSGQNGGANSGQCSYGVSQDGTCGGAAYSCNQGSAINGSGDGSVQYWQCSGTNGGSPSGQCVSHPDPGIVCGSLITDYKTGGAGDSDYTYAVYSGTCNIGRAGAVNVSSAVGEGHCSETTNIDIASWVCFASDGYTLNTCTVTSTYCTASHNDVGNH